MASTLSYNDGVLAISLFYLSIDMQYEWHDFEHCQWPVHRWLLASYIFILAFRLTHILGTQHAAAGSGDFLLNMRHKNTDLTWQALSYVWVLIHTSLGGIAWVLERRLRRTEDSLREIEDPETLARWGQVSHLPGYTALANNSLEGLDPKQIKKLPEVRASEVDLGEEFECSICLTELRPNDAVRQLAGCKHTFHRSCIDLWLLRRADCPLCKRSVFNSDCPCTTDTELEQVHV
eukprot:CAMPEP_0169293164 /NCGR_PEP_ID=MMETSP1016-20121227/63137_1 /TAXON_ID=342587 /ORGANISM="Karlodinium micrum, Strain CCMP2283" /LENGTH=233 /DNA_ID=CAMNT_0009383823 /DNA_START=70 /DNA_END=771 /DNA_ORIENTATION=+